MLTIKCIDMAEYRIKCEKGDGYIVASYKNRGDESLYLGTDGPNEGLDREQVITIETIEPNKDVFTHTALVKQKGKRVIMNDTEGALFTDADGLTFCVLKEEYRVK